MDDPLTLVTYFSGYSFYVAREAEDRWFVHVVLPNDEHLSSKETYPCYEEALTACWLTIRDALGAVLSAKYQNPN